MGNVLRPKFGDNREEEIESIDGSYFNTPEDGIVTSYTSGMSSEQKMAASIDPKEKLLPEVIEKINELKALILGRADFVISPNTYQSGVQILEECTDQQLIDKILNYDEELVSRMLNFYSALVNVTEKRFNLE